MKSLHAAILVLGVIASGTGRAQSPVSFPVDQTNLSPSTPLPVESPAEQRIAAAKRQIAANPKKVQAYNDLAAAYLRRVRETGNRKYCHDADEALAQGLTLDPGDFQLQKTQVVLLLQRHEYAEAKQKATLLHRRWLDDVTAFGYLAEADIALGDYPEAETNTQWMLNLLPNNVAGLEIGARLRTLYGDPEGAIEFLNLAYTETSPTEVEDQAWIANQIASIQIDSGKVDAAVSILERAEQSFPHYPYTLENLARVRFAQNRANDAVELLRQALQIDNDAHTLYELAQAELAAGQSSKTRGDLAEFEKLAAEPGNRSGDVIRDLILLYSGDPAKAARSLTLAQQEIEARHDVWTLDAYAWALYSNGKFQEADAAVGKAIAIGIRSAQIFDHAGHIAQKLNRDADAARYFELSIQSNPLLQDAADARASLGFPAVTKEQGLAASSDLPAQPAPASGGSAAPAASMHAPDTDIIPAKVGNAAPANGFPPISSNLLTPRPSDTERLIRNAQANAARNPEDAQQYAALGAAYFQRARETGDVSDYQLAEQTLLKSLDLDATDFSAASALGTMASVCMGEHRFTDALTYAHKALSLGSGDVTPFAIVGDAYADMGEYDKARAAYARLTPPDMTLSPRAAYARDSRISYLDFIAGDTEQAIRLMKIAVAEGTEAEIPAENLAWLYYELGEYYTQAGDSASADAAYVSALTIHPGDYRALAGAAKLRANHGRYAEAITLYQSAIAVVPMPMFITELGDLYAKRGNLAEAKKQYQLVEYIAQLGRINQVLHNRDLAIYYADHDIKLPEALQLAQKEFEVRRDVYTWDALAWAFYKNGRFADAAKASENAMQFGTRDALLLYHAGMIADRLGQKDKARAELNEALWINPHFHLLYAHAAQQALTNLDAASASHESAVSYAR